jgi:hypothetical protein
MATWLPTLYREDPDDGWNLQFPAVRRAIRQLEAVGGRVSTNPIWLDLPFGYRWKPPIETLSVVYAQYCERVSDADLRCISAFGRVNCLTVRGTPITGELLGFMRTPRRVSMLDLGQSSFDDDHARELLRFDRVEHLFLDRTRITDAAVEAILRLPALDGLWINHCRIGEASIRRLASHQRLRILHASPDQISASEALRLQRESNDRFEVAIGN